MVVLALILALNFDQPHGEQCSVIIPHPNGEGVTYQPVPDYRVVNATPPLSLPDGYPAVLAIVCLRDSLLPSDNDFRVLADLGVPMMIGTGNQLGSLEIADGRVRFRMIKGEFPEALLPQLQVSLDRGQLLLE